MDPKAHWESVHAESGADEVSWYQGLPTTSLRLIEAAGVGVDARVIDVGCGQAGLPGPLLDRGFRHVAALDISGEAIRRARERLGKRAGEVRWIEADVLDYQATEPFDVWHDRAVLHFLTSPADQARYGEAVKRNVAPGGLVLLATFAPDGPEKCSGLPVARHDAESLARLLGPAFAIQTSEREAHMTPWGAKQAFTWAVFRRAGPR